MIKEIFKEIDRERKAKEKRISREEKERTNWIKEINRNAKQPTLRERPTKEQINKLLDTFRKVKVI